MTKNYGSEHEVHYNFSVNETAVKPILYSFRRCPFAIRARMAIHYAGVKVELREIHLKDKPLELLQASAKGTVPVLVLSNEQVIDESLEIMRWAINQRDSSHWWQEKLVSTTNALIEINDSEFKQHLDHYKYADRYPQQTQLQYRDNAERFLQQLEQRLKDQQYLVGNEISFCDVAIFPFVRQFAFVDKHWFDQAPYPKLQHWLQAFLDSELFLQVMEKHPLWSPDQ